MIHAPGLYPNLSFVDYMADDSISRTDLLRLMQSPLCYWLHSRHNPDRIVDEGNEGNESTDYGTALHCRILEGQEIFRLRYATEITTDDFPGCLFSGSDLRARCGELGLPKSGTLAEMSERIRQKCPEDSARLWTDIYARHLEEIGGREEIDQATARNIEFAARAIEQCRAAKELLSGGRSEVSAFWVDEETGLPLKARLDYLRDPALIVDVKTFALRSPLQPLPNAVGAAMATHGYGVQAVMYMDGLKALRPESRPEFTFLFVQSGPVPNVVIRRFVKNSDGETQSVFLNNERTYRHLLGYYQHCVKQWGFERPWVEEPVVQDLVDEECPMWSL